MSDLKTIFFSLHIDRSHVSRFLENSLNGLLREQKFGNVQLIVHFDHFRGYYLGLTLRIEESLKRFFLSELQRTIHNFFQTIKKTKGQFNDQLFMDFTPGTILYGSHRFVPFFLIDGIRYPIESFYSSSTILISNIRLLTTSTNSAITHLLYFAIGLFLRLNNGVKLLISIPSTLANNNLAFLQSFQTYYIDNEDLFRRIYDKAHKIIKGKSKKNEWIQHWIEMHFQSITNYLKTNNKLDASVEFAKVLKYTLTQLGRSDDYLLLNIVLSNLLNQTPKLQKNLI
ncbi:hypothetical protein [Pedobacter sp. JY14-1]|uniref:hypothetical protein n=1 Tax=Pedobacter sp. JY14-1 TaxID=3034151 RepID=UPI0023E0A910|nr:hypothetical protein [Pedobacter sp. JY14-1]